MALRKTLEPRKKHKTDLYNDLLIFTSTGVMSSFGGYDLINDSKECLQLKLILKLASRILFGRPKFCDSWERKRL